MDEEELSEAIRTPTMHHTFLSSNSEAHAWALGAFADLFDNCKDADASRIDVWATLGGPHVGEIHIKDDGHGMSPTEVTDCLGLGYSKKANLNALRRRSGAHPGTEEGDDYQIGKYGWAFQTATIRLGQDCVVVTRQKDVVSVTLLSVTFHQDMGVKHTLTPAVYYKMPNSGKPKPAYEFCKGQDAKQRQKAWNTNLNIIVKYGMFEDRTALEDRVAQQKTSGTEVIIYTLHKDPIEFDLETDPTDIMIRKPVDETGRSSRRPYQVNPEKPWINDLDYSLRNYAAILYLEPAIDIYIQSKKVVFKDPRSENNLDTCLSVVPIYMPASHKRGGARRTVKREDGSEAPAADAMMWIGFNSENSARNHEQRLRGIHLYWCNRLIIPYNQMSQMRQNNSMMKDVLGVVTFDDLTCDVAPNKQKLKVKDDRRVPLMGAINNEIRKWYFDRQDYRQAGKTQAHKARQNAMKGRSRAPRTSLNLFGVTPGTDDWRTICRVVVAALKREDKNKLFHELSHDALMAAGADDYFDIIDKPMSFRTVETKLRSDKYKDPSEFRADLDLVFSNACTYNTEGPFREEAEREAALLNATWMDLCAKQPAMFKEPVGGGGLPARPRPKARRGAKRARRSSEDVSEPETSSSEEEEAEVGSDDSDEPDDFSPPPRAKAHVRVVGSSRNGATKTRAQAKECSTFEEIGASLLPPARPSASPSGSPAPKKSKADGRSRKEILTAHRASRGGERRAPEGRDGREASRGETSAAGVVAEVDELLAEREAQVERRLAVTTSAAESRAKEAEQRAEEAEARTKRAEDEAARLRCELDDMRIELEELNALAKAAEDEESLRREILKSDLAAEHARDLARKRARWEEDMQETVDLRVEEAVSARLRTFLERGANNRRVSDAARPGAHTGGAHPTPPPAPAQRPPPQARYEVAMRGAVPSNSTQPRAVHQETFSLDMS